MGMLALGISFIVLSVSYGISSIGSSAVQSIARQPESASDIRISMILMGALIEGVGLFALVICLLIALQK